MRVIAGRLGGRLFASPGTHRTHPMSDKARGALFNILGDIAGLHVLDPFGGTGALSIEAISRGATAAVVIEADRQAQKVIAANIAALGLASEVTLIGGMANSWLNKNKHQLFDIVICDPPYSDLQYDLVEKLESTVKPGGIFVVSWPSSADLPRFRSLTLVDQRTYGDMQLVFYRRMQ